MPESTGRSGTTGQVTQRPFAGVFDLALRLAEAQEGRRQRAMLSGDFHAGASVPLPTPAAWSFGSRKRPEGRLLTI